MSLVAHHSRDLPNDTLRIARTGNMSAPSFASGKALLMQGLRMLGVALAIAAVVTTAAAIKLAIWLPLYWR